MNIKGVDIKFLSRISVYEGDYEWPRLFRTPKNELVQACTIMTFMKLLFIWAMPEFLKLIIKNILNYTG